jgi:hypothetical protein
MGGNPLPRQTDKDKQLGSTPQDDYSGKQKNHMCKNELVVDTNKIIYFISTSVEGKVHDKTLCDNL